MKRSMRFVSGCALGVVLVGWVGCGPGGWADNSPRQGSTSQPASDGAAASAPVNPFGPLAPPAQFDPAKAKLALSQLPNDPAAPGKPTTRPAALPDAARRRLEEARRLFAEQRYSETAIEAEKAIRYEPNNAESHRLIALASLLSGNEPRAKLSAERALSIDPDNLACHFVLARFAEKGRKTDEALSAYRAALKCEAFDDDRPYKALTQYYLGRLLFDAGYYAAAAAQLEAFEESLTALGEKVADNPELATIARIRRGEAAMISARARGYLGQYAAAADALKKVVARSARDFDVRAEYVRMLMRARRVDAATDQAAQLLADSQGSSDSVQLLVAVHSASGHPERAISTIKSVVARQPDNTDLWLVYVDTLWNSGRKNEAFTALRDLLARHPEANSARWKLIELHRQREEWAAWANQIAEYIAAEPAQATRAADQLRQIPVSAVEPLLGQLESTRTAATTQPAEVLSTARDYVRGHLFERLDRLDDARKAYDAALARSPESVPLAMAIGGLYLDRCLWKDAIGVLEAVQKKRSHALSQIEYFLGRAFEGLDQVSDAVTHYGMAGRLDRANVRAFLSLARLHERTGNARDALKQYQAAISADGASMPAREGLVRLMLAQISSDSETRDQQGVLNHVLGELAEMQKTGPHEPATLRCAALVQFLFVHERSNYIETLQRVLRQFPAETQTREDLYRVLLDGRDYEPALQVARELVSRDRCSASGLEMLATVQLRLLKFEEACRQYEHMLEMYPNREQWLGQYAELNALMRRYDKSIALYERLLKLDNVEGKSEAELGYRDKLVQMYRRAGRYDDARKLCEKWMADAKEDRLRQRYRGLLLATDLAAKDYDRYLARCREWLKDDPKSSELNRLLMLGMLKAEQYDQAIAAALRWMAASPDDDRLDWMGDILEGARHYAGAIEISRGLLATATETEKKRARLTSLASLYVNAKRYDPAIASLKQLILQAQTSEAALYAFELQKMLARVFVQANRPEESVRLLNKMLNDINDITQQTGENIELRYKKLGEAVKSEEGRKKLAEELDRAKKLAAASQNPRKAELLRQMYWAYHKQGQMDVAEQRLREALALAPNEPGICNDLGYTLADAGKNPEEARRLTALAVGEEPMQAAYLDSYAWALYKLGRFAEARQWLEWSSGLEGGEDAVICDHLADTLWRLGDKKAALASWKRSIEINERLAKEGDETAEKNLPERVQAKIKAVQAGKEPAVAKVAATTRPGA